MAASAKLFNKFIWLTELIYSAGKITREEIDKRWSQSSLNEENETYIPRRTFLRWKNEIEELFHIIINCDKSNNAYYIENTKEIAENKTMQWLLNTFAVTNIINESEQIQNRILLEKIPSDSRFLAPIVEAMRLERVLEVTYRKFGDSESHCFLMEPYCVKVFKLRWYMVGRSTDHPDEVRVYALDRIVSMNITDKSYHIPEDFDGNIYFSSYYGVWTGEEKPEKIRIKVTSKSADYLRSLPLHHSQQEIERTDSYSIFEYFIAPTFDFRQELLTHGAELIVQEPEWLVQEFRRIGCKYNQNYQ